MMPEITASQLLQRKKASQAAARNRIKKVDIDSTIIDTILEENKTEIRKARREQRSPRITVATAPELLNTVAKLRNGGIPLRREHNRIVASINGTDWDINLKK